MKYEDEATKKQNRIGYAGIALLFGGIIGGVLSGLIIPALIVSVGGVALIIYAYTKA